MVTMNLMMMLMIVVMKKLADDDDDGDVVVRVTQTPQTLDELGEGLLLWEHLNMELPATEAKIAPLFDQFAILDKYEVKVADDVRARLLDLPNKFRDFQQTLADADIMLKKHKVCHCSILTHIFNLLHLTVSVRSFVHPFVRTDLVTTIFHGS